MLDSKTADINNVSEGGMAGAITAALYLEEFVDRTTPWIHLDIMAWNLAARPGRPIGGEAQGNARALRPDREPVRRKRGARNGVERSGRDRVGRDRLDIERGGDQAPRV